MVQNGGAFDSALRYTVSVAAVFFGILIAGYCANSLRINRGAAALTHLPQQHCVAGFLASYDTSAFFDRGFIIREHQDRLFRLN